MGKKKSLKVNFLMNSVLTLSSFIFPIISFPYVSRILLPEGTGKVSLASSIVTYFMMFAQLGIPVYGIRVCAKARDDKTELTRTTHELLIINSITTLLAYMALIVCIFTIDRLNEEKALYLITGILIILSTIGMEWLYKALEQYTYITIRSLVFKVIAFVSMFLLIHRKEDYVIYAAITIFASSASSILNFINVHKYIYLRPIGNYNLKRHLKPIIIFFAMSCATIVYTNLDTIMLGFMTTDTEVGYYNAAIKIRTILLHFVTALGAVLLPRASYYIEKNKIDDFKRIANKALEFIFVTALSLMIYFMIFSKEGIFFLSGEAYSGSIIPMQVIMPTLLFAGITNITGIQVLIPMGKEKTVFYSEVVGAIIDIVMNALLIPFLGSTGAAIGTLLAEIGVFIYQLIEIRKLKILSFKTIRYFPICIGILLGSMISLLVKKFDFSYFLTLVISSLLFFGLYGLTLLLCREPITMEAIHWIYRRKKQDNI